MVSHLDSMVARYRTGEPLQYVLGEWSFRHLTLAVDRRVLIPRPETELVAEVAIELGPQRASRRAPSPTSAPARARSGCRWRTNCRVEGTEVWITDASADARRRGPSEPCRHRSCRCERARRARARGSRRCPTTSQFDVIVSNPPYVAVGSPDLDAVVERVGTGDARCSPATTGSTTSASSPPERPIGCGAVAASCWRSAPIRAAAVDDAAAPSRVSSTSRSARDLSRPRPHRRSPAAPPDGPARDGPGRTVSRSGRRPRRGSCLLPG